jgi:hypothetical protein
MGAPRRRSDEKENQDMAEQKNGQQPPVTTSAPASATAQTAEPAKKRHTLRRILIVVGVILGLVVVFLAALPSLLSTASGRDKILGMVNGKIRGNVQAAGLSLSWFSPCEIEGLVVTAPQDRRAMKVPRVRWSRGLWSALWSSGDLGELHVTAPELYLNEDGSMPLAEAFQSRSPAPAAAPSKPMDLSAFPSVTLSWEKACIHVMHADGRQNEFVDANGTDGTIKLLSALNDIQAHATVVQAGGGTVTLAAGVRDLFAGGALNLDKAAGQITVKTDPQIDVAPLGQFGPAGAQATGKIAIDANLQFSPGGSAGTWSIRTTGLSAAANGTAVTPTDLSLAGSASYKSGTLEANTAVAGKIATLATTLRYTKSDKPLDLSIDKVYSALVEGKSIALPDFALSVDGNIDLAEAGKSIPSLLQIREGVAIAPGSKLEIAKVEAHGGASPGAEARARLDLVTVEGGNTKTWKPMLVDVLATSSKGPLAFERGVVQSSFAEANAIGTLSDLLVTFRANLQAMRRELADVVDLKDKTMNGTVSGTFETRKAKQDGAPLEFALLVDANEVQYGSAATGATTAPAPAAAAKPGSMPAPEGPPIVTAQLAWNGTVDRKPGRLAILGKAEIRRLYEPAIGEAFPGDRPVIEHALYIYDKENRMDANVAVRAKILNMTVGGKVTDLDNKMLLDLKGDYSASWPELMPILRRLAPGAVNETVAMAGESSGPFRLTGPAKSPKLEQGLPDVDGKTAFGWKSGSKLYGLDLGDAKFEPTLNSNEIKVPVAAVPANGGTMNLGCQVDLRGKDPVLNIPGKLDVLQNVGINEIVGTEVLSRALPLLGNLAKLDGKVSLSLEDVHVPLSAAIKKTGSGRGRLDLSDIRLRATGPLGDLLKLLGPLSDQPFPVKVSAVDFELKDGALKYDNLTMTIGTFDLKFHGVVRFDDSVELWVSVPICPSLLEKFGVKGPLDQFAKVLEGTRIDIPISGTRKNPSLDLAKVDIKPLIEQATKKIIEQGGSLLPKPGELPKLPIEAPKLPTELPKPPVELPKILPSPSPSPSPSPADANAKPKGGLLPPLPKLIP